MGDKTGRRASAEGKRGSKHLFERAALAYLLDYSKKRLADPQGKEGRTDCAYTKRRGEAKGGRGERLQKSYYCFHVIGEENHYYNKG